MREHPAACRAPGRHRAAADGGAPAGGAGDRRPLDLVGRLQKGRSDSTSAAPARRARRDPRRGPALQRLLLPHARAPHDRPDGIEQRFEAARNAVTETGTELYVEIA